MIDDLEGKDRYRVLTSYKYQRGNICQENTFFFEWNEISKLEYKIIRE